MKADVILVFLAWSGLLTGISAFVFGCFVYFKNARHSVNRAYGLLSLSLVIWGVAYYFWPLPASKLQALVAFRVLHYGAILVVPSYVWFIFALLGKEGRFRAVIRMSFLAAAPFFLSVPTRFFISDMVPQGIFKYWAVPGILYHVYLVYWFGFTFFAAWHLFVQMRSSVGSRRNQLRYVLLSSIFGFLGGGTNYLPWYGISVPPAGTILVMAHIVLLAYAIIRYRLMDIRAVITRTGIFAGVYAPILAMPFLLVGYGRGMLVALLGENWWWGPLLLLGLLATAGPYLYIYLQSRAESLFLREQLRYQDILRQTSLGLARIRKPAELFELIVSIVSQDGFIPRVAVYLVEGDSKVFVLKAGRDISGAESRMIGADARCVSWLAREKAALLYEEMRTRTQEEPGAPQVEEARCVEREMQSLKAAALIPIFISERLSGIILVGDKRSQKPYLADDLNIYAVLASQAALAIENALLYENIEEQVRQRTAELMDVQKQLIQAEKLASVGTLAGGVAHEINNPLTAILTNVQMLLADPAAFDADTKESLELMEEATKRCRTIVQKLMVYAKKPLEAAAAAEFDAVVCVRNTVAFLQYQLSQDTIAVDAALSAAPVMILGSANEFEQVLTNLLLNARDAIVLGKKPGRIDISLETGGGNAFLRVRDDGVGMSAATLAKIFDPFFTTKDVGKGLGLGLSICQSIVEKHKGSILVDSAPGRGACFTVRIPLAQASGTRRERRTHA